MKSRSESAGGKSDNKSRDRDSKKDKKKDDKKRTKSKNADDDAKSHKSGKSSKSGKSDKSKKSRSATPKRDKDGKTYKKDDLEKKKTKKVADLVTTPSNQEENKEANLLQANLTLAGSTAGTNLNQGPFARGTGTGGMAANALSTICAIH